jgi:hypothetical protein
MHKISKGNSQVWYVFGQDSDRERNGGLKNVAHLSKLTSSRGRYYHVGEPWSRDLGRRFELVIALPPILRVSFA